MTDRNDDAPQAPDDPQGAGRMDRAVQPTTQTQHCARCDQDVVPVPLDPEIGTKCPNCGALLSGSTSEPAAAPGDKDETGRSTAAAHHDRLGETHDAGGNPKDPSDASGGHGDVDGDGKIVEGDKPESDFGPGTKSHEQAEQHRKEKQ